MITAAAAGAAVLAAQAASSALPGVVAAGDGDPVTVGKTNLGTGSTAVATADASPSFAGRSGTGDGLMGWSAGNLKSGVYGVSEHTGGYGVFGRNEKSHATGHLGGPQSGVEGVSPAGDTRGLLGAAETGVVGVNTTAGIVGYLGGADIAVAGVNAKDGTQGHLGGMDAGAGGAHTNGTQGYLGGSVAGAEGINTQAHTRGVLGHKNAGVRAVGTAGIPALWVEGTVYLNRSGLATVAKGQISVRVTGVTLDKLAQAGLAMIQAHRPGIAVAATVVDSDAGTVTIYLTKKVAAATPVVFYLFGAPPIQ